jgi:voltage-gated sodium channel
MLVRIFAEALSLEVDYYDAPSKYLQNNWNKFDVIAVPLAIIGSASFPRSDKVESFLKFFRFVVVLRAGRLFWSLRASVESLSQALTSSVGVIIIYIVFNFILACVGMMAFRENDPFHWDSLNKALFSVWRIESGDSWEQILKLNMYGCLEYVSGYPMTYHDGYECTERNNNASGYWAWIYVLTASIFGNFVIPAALAGVLIVSYEKYLNKFAQDRAMDSMMELLGKEAKALLPRWWSDERKFLIEETFKILDFNESGTI